MFSFRILACGLVLILVGPGISLAQKTTVDWDRDADFSKYQTYMWSEGSNVPSPLQHQRLVSAVESELSAIGIEKVESNPDIYVTYHASATENVSYHTSSFGYGYGRRWTGSGSSTTRAYSYVKGTIVLDLWEAQSKTLVWRGTATDTLSENPEKNTKKIHKAVEKIFKKYPPEK